MVKKWAVAPVSATMGELIVEVELCGSVCTWFAMLGSRFVSVFLMRFMHLVINTGGL